MLEPRAHPPLFGCSLMLQFLIPLVGLQPFPFVLLAPLETPGTSFRIALGSFQFGTDAEIAGVTLALLKLSNPISWTKAILASESRAAIRALSCLNWKSSRASALRFCSLWISYQG